MNFEIYKENKEPEKKVFFLLVKERDGVRLTVVDKHGNWKRNILTIYDDGLYLHCAANGFGFPTDKEGRIVISKPLYRG